MRKIDVLREDGVDDCVQLLGGREVAAKRLFHHHARALGAARAAQGLHHSAEKTGRDGQIVGGPARGTKHLAKLREGGGILIIAVDILQQAGQFCEGSIVHAAVLAETIVGALLKLFQRPARFRHANHRHIQFAVEHHLLQRGKNLLVGQVAGSAKKYQCIGRRAGRSRRASPSKRRHLYGFQSARKILNS